MSTARSSSAPQDRFGLVGTVLADKFQVTEAVAEGGFGVVYAAEHLNLSAVIALKVLKIPSHLNDQARREFLANFIQEARTIARIRHPNIVQVLDTGVSDLPNGDMVPWIALEWLEGQTLERELMANARRGRPPAEVFAVMRPVMEALAFAHDAGVAHRDIKPANIMLLRTRTGVIPKLLDFGIAKVMDASDDVASSGSTHTESAFQMFSPQWAAPEQIAKTRTGPWTDVHALGLIVTAMLTGVPPYGAREMADLMRAVLSEQRPTPRSIGVNVGAWEPVLARALAVRPDARQPDAAALLSELEAALPRATHSVDTLVGLPVPGATVGWGSSAARGASGPTPAPPGSDPGPAPALDDLPTDAHTTSSGAAISVSTERRAIPGRHVAVAAGALVALLAGVGFFVVRLTHPAQPAPSAAAAPMPRPIALPPIPVPAPVVAPAPAPEAPVPAPVPVVAAPEAPVPVAAAPVPEPEAPAPTRAHAAPTHPAAAHAVRRRSTSRRRDADPMW